MKVSVIFGTRPEIIKLSPVIRALESARIKFFIVHSNQHYDKNMDEVFLNELKLPKAKYNLKVGSGTHAETTGKIMIAVEKILAKEKPNIVIIQGDTNTVLASALSASKLQIPIAHVEAGLRSYSKIPEETNRILTDHISSFLFTPTKKQQEILIEEGISKKKIHIVGNTIVDAVQQNLKLIKTHNSKDKDYFIITIHREENVDNPSHLKSILSAVSQIQKDHNIEAIFPIHPRTKKRLKEFDLKIPKRIKTTEPIGYLEMLSLMSKAKFILTDSGGIQEEACTLQIPCLTMRESTERPESVEVGANVVVGTNKKRILQEVKKVLSTKNKKWQNPFGTGKSAKKIVQILKQEFDKKK